jgi:hypothetical protein
VTIPFLHVTNHSAVTLALYITAEDGSVLNRCNQVVNVLTTDSQTFAVTSGDYTAEDPLYTNGGVLEAIQPPPYRIATLWQNRHFVVDRQREDSRIYYSREFAESTGLQHSDVLTIDVTSAGGPITALAVLNDRLIVFKETRIYSVSGRGRDNLGFGQGYNPARLVNPSIGCTDQKSVVLLPQGLAFLSQDSLALLLPNDQVQPFGRPVKYYSDTYAISSANVIPEKHYAIWTTSDGPAIVFDFLFEQWSTFSGAYSSAPDATVAGGILYWRDSSDGIRVEDRSKFLDLSASYKLTIETGWFSFAGLLGFVRWYLTTLLGQSLTKHTLRVKVAYDFDPEWIDITQTFDSEGLAYFAHTEQYGTLASSREDQSYLLDFAGSRQKVTAVRFHFSDEDNGGTASAEAFSLSGLTFTVGLEKGAKQVGDDRKVS